MVEFWQIASIGIGCFVAGWLVCLEYLDYRGKLKR